MLQCHFIEQDHMNMKQLGSFTLRPSSAFSAYTDGNSEIDSSESLPQSLVVSGTVLSDFQGSDRRSVDPEAGLGIRASPFEPLVHDRNLPKSGTISPLNVEEYKAWRHRGTRSRAYVGIHNVTDTGPRHDGDEGLAPSHHFFPTDSHLIPVSVDRNDVDAETWKLRYLQSEMARTEVRTSMVSLMEEKRKLQVQLIEAEAQLHHQLEKRSFLHSEIPHDEGWRPVSTGCDARTEIGTTDLPGIDSSSGAHDKESPVPIEARKHGSGAIYVNPKRGSRLSTSSDRLSGEFAPLDCNDGTDALPTFLLPGAENTSKEESPVPRSVTFVDEVASYRPPEGEYEPESSINGSAYMRANSSPCHQASQAAISQREKEHQEQLRPGQASPEEDTVKKISLVNSVATCSRGAMQASGVLPVEKRLTRSRAKVLKEAMPPRAITVPSKKNESDITSPATNGAKPRRRISIGGMTFTPLLSNDGSQEENASDAAKSSKVQEREQKTKRDPHRRKRKSLRNSFQAPVLRQRTRNRA